MSVVFGAAPQSSLPLRVAIWFSLALFFLYSVALPARRRPRVAPAATGPVVMADFARGVAATVSGNPAAAECPRWRQSRVHHLQRSCATLSV